MIKTEEISIPGFGPLQKEDMTKYKVKYLKASLDEVDQRTDLEIIESRGLEGKDIVIIAKDKFTFMDKYFVIVTYLEKETD